MLSLLISLILYFSKNYSDKKKALFNIINDSTYKTKITILDDLFIKSIKLDDKKTIKLLLDRNDINAECKNTLLMIASKKGSIKIVKLLLHSGADVNASNKDGATALLFASWINQEIVKLLLANGADVDSQNVICTPL